MSTVKKVRLTQPQSFRLCKWLETEDLTPFESFEACAEAASKALAFPLTKSNVESCLAIVGVELPAHQYRSTAEQRAIVVLSRALTAVNRHLGIASEPALLALLAPGSAPKPVEPPPPAPAPSAPVTDAAAGPAPLADDKGEPLLRPVDVIHR